MRRIIGVGVAVAALAAVPAFAFRGSPPPGATALCRDGTYSFSQHHSGTCSHHGGVAKWLDGSSTASGSSGGSYATGGSCGVERWTVKTLQDRPRLLPAVRTTIHYLVTRPVPEYTPSVRLPFERDVFTVTGSVALVRHESDQDFHVVLAAGKDEMITESPSASCDTRATPLRRRQMALARSRITYCNRAQVTGVAFFDSEHGQTGVAPNGIELHPILGFRCVG
jgi:hypothetical protein